MPVCRNLTNSISEQSLSGHKNSPAHHAQAHGHGHHAHGHAHAGQLPAVGDVEGRVDLYESSLAGLAVTHVSAEEIAHWHDHDADPK